MKIDVDEYSRRARIAPMLLVLLPVALTVIGWNPGNLISWAGVGSLLLTAGGSVLLANLGSLRGKAKEPELWKRLGGRPTERKMSRRGGGNPHTMDRRRRRLRELLPALVIPTSEAEDQDYDSAILVYAGCTDYLIAKTRDHSKFHQLFEANCDFGFRRNAWGLKPFGLLTSLAGSAILGSRVYGDMSAHLETQPVLLVLTATNVALVIFWLLVDPKWIKPCAETYADRLIESIDNL